MIMFVFIRQFLDLEGQGLGKVVSQQVSRHAMAWSGCLA